MESMVCNFCCTEKSLSAFRKSKVTKNGHSHPCKKCNALHTAISRFLRSLPFPRLLVLSHPTETTRCSQCHSVKPLKDFPLRGRAKSGHKQPCKRCGTLNQAKLDAARKAADPVGYLEKKRQDSALWVARNGEKRRAISRASARRHPETTAAGGARYRARKAGATLVDRVDRQRVFARDKWICQLCGVRVKKSLRFPHPGSASLDHIIPLSQGGEESYRNCVLAHFGCNAKKQARAVPQQLRLIS